VFLKGDSTVFVSAKSHLQRNRGFQNNFCCPTVQLEPWKAPRFYEIGLKDNEMNTSARWDGQGSVQCAEYCGTSSFDNRPQNIAGGQHFALTESAPEPKNGENYTTPEFLEAAAGYWAASPVQVKIVPSIKNLVCLCDSSSNFVLKAFNDKFSIARITEILTLANYLKDSAIGDLIAAPLVSRNGRLVESVDGTRFVAFERLPGVRWSQSSSPLSHVANTLQKFQDALASARQIDRRFSLKGCGTIANSAMDEKWQAVREAHQDLRIPEWEEMRRLALSVEQDCAKIAWRLTDCHGDWLPQNLLAEDGQCSIVGILDLDEVKRGPWCLDPIAFSLHTSSSAERMVIDLKYFFDLFRRAGDDFDDMLRLGSYLCLYRCLRSAELERWKTKIGLSFRWFWTRFQHLA
jgi:Ser/Thr protein kinase RdoA (MazF antagonist)